MGQKGEKVKVEWVLQDAVTDPLISRPFPPKSPFQCPILFSSSLSCLSFHECSVRGGIGGEVVSKGKKERQTGPGAMVTKGRDTTTTSFFSCAYY